MSQDRSKNWKIKAQLENLIYENHKANRSRSFEKSHARAKSNTEHRIQPRVKSLPTHFFRMRAERFGSDPVSEIVSSLGVSRGGGLPRKKRLLDDRERSGARSHRDKRRMPVFGDRRRTRTRNDRSEKRRSPVQHPACASPPQAEEVRTETRFQSSRSPLGKARLRAHTGLPESRDSNGDPRRGWHHIVARADAPAYLADADALAMHNTDTIPRTSALSRNREREREEACLTPPIHSSAIRATVFVFFIARSLRSIRRSRRSRRLRSQLLENFRRFTNILRRGV